LMYVGVVELLRNLPLCGGRFDSPLIRDLESRRDVLTGQSTGWALVYATSLRSLRLLCGEYRQIECKNLYAIWRRNHGERSHTINHHSYNSHQLELELIQTQMTTNAAGRSGNARALRKQSKCGVIHEEEGHWPKFSQKLQKARHLWVARTLQKQ